jgi:hypothetical protein
MHPAQKLGCKMSFRSVRYGTLARSCPYPAQTALRIRDCIHASAWLIALQLSELRRRAIAVPVRRDCALPTTNDAPTPVWKSKYPMRTGWPVTGTTRPFALFVLMSGPP